MTVGVEFANVVVHHAVVVIANDRVFRVGHNRQSKTDTAEAANQTKPNQTAKRVPSRPRTKSDNSANCALQGVSEWEGFLARSLVGMCIDQCYQGMNPW